VFCGIAVTQTGLKVDRGHKEVTKLHKDFT